MSCNCLSCQEWKAKLEKVEDENTRLRFHIVILANTLGECIECSAKYGEEHEQECEIGGAIAGHSKLIHELEVKYDELFKAKEKVDIERDKLRELVDAVVCDAEEGGMWCSMYCKDINGVNWFDLRDELSDQEIIADLDAIPGLKEQAWESYRELVDAGILQEEEDY